MYRSSGLFRFPGGVLELQASGDESEDYSGFYLEFLKSDEDGGERELLQERSDTRYKPTCFGYLRTDVSGVAQLWDQSQIRKLATRLGYDFADMVIYDPRFGHPPLARLKAQATRLDAEAVIVPSSEHFEGAEIPLTLVQQLDVITVTPEVTYARRTVLPGSSSASHSPNSSPNSGDTCAATSEAIPMLGTSKEGGRSKQEFRETRWRCSPTYFAMSPRPTATVPGASASNGVVPVRWRSGRALHHVNVPAPPHIALTGAYLSWYSHHLDTGARCAHYG